jgi:vitamin B12 transporter
MRFTFRVLVLLSASWITGVAHAQTEENAPLPIIVDPAFMSKDAMIVVNGGLLDKPKSDDIANIDFIFDPNQSAGQSVEGLLRGIPGLQQFRRSDSRSANASSQGVTLRGLGGNASSRAIVLLDGIPQADPFGGWIAWTALDAVNLRGIRVLHGGGGGADGPGAIAGTISLSSNVHEGKEFSLSGGSFGSIDADANLGFSLGDGEVAINANFGRSDGFVPIIQGQRGAADRAAPYQHQGLGLRSIIHVSDDLDLETSVRAFSDKRDRGLDFSTNKNDGVDASVRLVNRYGSGMQWTALAYVQLRNFASQFGSVSADRSIITPTLDQFSVPSTGLGARFELRPQIGSDAELRIGGDWRRTIGQTRENSNFVSAVPTRSRTAGGQGETVGAFVEGSWQTDDTLLLTASGRLDYWALTKGFRRELNINGVNPGSVRTDDRFANRSGTETTARAGFAVTPAYGVKFRGAAYLGWRLPTLNELYRPFRVGVDATAANELLTPEQLRGGEIGLDFDHSDSKASLTTFWNRVDDAIANVGAGIGPGTFPGVGFVASGGVYRRRENIGAIESKGIELTASQNLGRFNLGASYAYVDAKVKDSGIATALSGKRPAQVPKHFVSTSLDWQNGDNKVGLTVRYVSDQFEDDANSRRLADALTFDFGVAWRLIDNVMLDLRGENLLDARVEVAVSSSGIIERAIPRTLWLGLRVALD